MSKNLEDVVNLKVAMSKNLEDVVNLKVGVFVLTIFLVRVFF